MTDRQPDPMDPAEAVEPDLRNVDETDPVDDDTRPPFDDTPGAAIDDRDADAVPEPNEPG